MFTMTLCDRNPCSTIRAVCFDELFFDKFQATKTYDIKNFKLKSGFGTYDSVEILISEGTEVTESLVQFRIEKTCFKICQIIRRETSNVRFFNLKAKVVSIEEAVTVGTYPNEKLKRDITLGDDSGQITLVLWRQRASSVKFEEGDVIKIENAVTSSFNGKVLVTTSGETTIGVTSEEIEVEVATAPLASPGKKRLNVISVETAVLALRDFKCSYRCLGCRKDIEWHGSATSNDGNVTLACPACSTVFLGNVSKIKNEGLLMLSYNDQWFSAGTGVMQHIFDSPSPKRKPTKEDTELLLSSKYSMRLDVDRKIIEHAIILPGMGNDELLEQESQCTPSKQFKGEGLREAQEPSDTNAPSDEVIGMVFDKSNEEKDKVD